MVSADVDKWLEWLMTSTSTQITENIDDLMKELIANYSGTTVDALQNALNRIQLDNKVFGKCMMRLSNILIRMYQLIRSHQHNNELIKRLYEELIEMNDWCSTGHIVRLMNVFNGFDYTGLSIDPAIELRSVVNKRIENFLQEAAKRDTQVEVRVSDDEDEKMTDATINSSNLIVTNTMNKKQNQSLYDIVMDAWMNGDDAILQVYLYPLLSRIHDEVFKDYVGQGIMKEQEFAECYRNVVSNLFIK
jgi:hypothetical protein